MTEAPAHSLAMMVVNVLRGAHKSREVLEAELPDSLLPLNDDQVLLQTLVTAVHRQGLLLAQLALTPSTRAELLSRLPGLTESAPAWLDARVRGDRPMTATLFMRGLAQTLTVHRQEFERVVNEQVADPGLIEQALAEAPVPAGTEDEGQPELISGVSEVMRAHTFVLGQIAFDIETQIEGSSDEEK